MDYLRDRHFYLALVLVAAVVVVPLGTYQRWWSVQILAGPFYLHRWLTWTGATFIAVFTPVYYLWKRRSAGNFSNILTTHVFVNLGAI